MASREGAAFGHRLVERSPLVREVLKALGKAAAETEEEYGRRWPYNAQVVLDSRQARALLLFIHELEARL